MDLEALQKAVKLSQAMTAEQEPCSPRYSPSSPRFDPPSESPPRYDPSRAAMPTTTLFGPMEPSSLGQWIHPDRQQAMIAPQPYVQPYSSSYGYSPKSPPLPPPASQPRRRSKSPARYRSPPRHRERSPHKHRERSPIRHRDRSPPRKPQAPPYKGGQSLGQTVDKMKQDHSLLVKKVVDLENTIAVLQDSIHQMQAKMNTSESSSRKRSRHD